MPEWRDVICPVSYTHLLPNLNRFKLDTVAKALGVSLENHHRAVDDAEATAGIFLKFVEMLKKQHDMTTLDQLEEFSHVRCV